jgi:hypothetical protein
LPPFHSHGRHDANDRPFDAREREQRQINQELGERLVEFSFGEQLVDLVFGDLGLRRRRASLRPGALLPSDEKRAITDRIRVDRLSGLHLGLCFHTHELADAGDNFRWNVRIIRWVRCPNGRSLAQDKRRAAASLRRGTSSRSAAS